MSSKRSNKHLLAKVVTSNGKYGACAFCHRSVNDEVGYGKLYAIGDIYCHYFCVLLSCCLVQKGEDEEGLLGFLYSDILAEVERSKKHTDSKNIHCIYLNIEKKIARNQKCSYCSRGGATLGCSVSQCRKQFHLPCGREHRSLSLFHGNYKSYCENHAPRQHVDEKIMAKAKLRMQMERRKKANKNAPTSRQSWTDTKSQADNEDINTVCVICYEEVPGYPATNTFWPPCCARDAWLHRTCLERMALSAGIHYLKCPLCNDKDIFYRAVVTMGYYVPDRDAAWELEQNAFAEIYDRHIVCRAEVCKCPLGRKHDSETGEWDIKLCLLCGGGGAHSVCLPQGTTRIICDVCAPVAPEDLDQLEHQISQVIKEEQETAIILKEDHETARVNSQVRGPVMPCRMSIRRTKQRPSIPASASTSRSELRNIRNDYIAVNQEQDKVKSDIKSSRLELNLKSPRKQSVPNMNNNILKGIENIMSPEKYLDDKLTRRLNGISNEFDTKRLKEKLRVKFKKPRPLSAKKEIVNTIFSEMLKEVTKVKLPLKDWNSPKKQSCQTDEQEISKPPMKAGNEPSKENAISCDDIEETTKDDIEKSTDCNIFDENTVMDESSNSTFQLPSEFVADHNSDDSLPVFETPKKCITINIEKDSSMEISEKNESVSIDLIKMCPDIKSDNIDKLKHLIPDKKCFQFSPLDEDILQANNIDIETKNQYLTEVPNYKCDYNHKHGNVDGKISLRTAIDFAIEAAVKKEKNQDHSENFQNENTPKRHKGPVKRKLVADERKNRKKRKLSRKNKYSLKCENRRRSVKIKLVYDNKSVTEDVIGLTVKSDKVKKLNKGKKTSKTKISIRKKDIKLKIKWKLQDKSKQKLKYTKKVKPVTPQQMTQTIINFSPENTSPKNILKPDNKVVALKKRKTIKHEKSSDGLKQMSIQNFFKVKTEPL